MDTTTGGNGHMDFADFYQATSHRTLRYAYGLTGDLQQAQDVTQEAYTRAWQRWRQVSGYHNIEAWLRLVVNRLVQDWWRHLGVRSRTRLEAPPPLPGPTEDAVLLAAALKQLPKTQARALALFYLLDLPIAEIAAETGVGESTVRSWLSRGRAGLADRLRDEADTASVPDVADVAAAGRRRRRTRMVTTLTAASLAVLLLLGAAVAVLRARHADHPVTPAPSGTALHRIGEPLPTTGEAITLLAGGRAFVAANVGGSLRITALDAASGHLLWTQALAGMHFQGSTMKMIGGVLAIIDLAADPAVASTLRNQLTVVDVASGALLWQHELADPDGNGPALGETPLFLDQVAILTVWETGAMKALDWRTGRTRWTLPAGGKPMLEAGPRPSGDTDIARGGLDLATMSTVFYRVEGKTLRAYDPGTGRPTGKTWTGLPAGANDARNFLWRGKLYLVDDTHVATFDLGGDGPTVSYTAHPTAPGTRENRRLNTVVPCAGDAVCLLDGGNPEEERGRNPYQVVLLRAGAAPVTQDLGNDDWVIPIRTTVYLARGDIFDDHLRVIKPPALAGTTTVGVSEDGTALLARAAEPGYVAQPQAIRLFTFETTTHAVKDLGGLTAVDGTLVAGDHRILAITADGISLYAY